MKKCLLLLMVMYGMAAAAEPSDVAALRVNLQKTLIKELKVNLARCAELAEIERGNMSESSVNYCQGLKKDEEENFLHGFQAKRLRPKAVALFAQWMTCIDTVGTRAGQLEQAKFNTQANELSLDLSEK